MLFAELNFKGVQMKFSTGFFDAIFGEKTTIEVRQDDGMLMKVRVTTAWLKKMQDEEKMNMTAAPENAVHLHIVGPDGLEHDQLIVGKDIPEEQYKRFVDPETGALYAIKIYERGVPKMRVISKEMWVEAKQEMDAIESEGQVAIVRTKKELNSLVGDDKEHKIRIHPPGTQITDPEAVEKLAHHAPTAFRQVQDVLVATEKYINKSGFFSSDRSRLQKMQSECYKLVRALKQDGFMANELSQKGEVYVLIEFLSLFSDAFPNWQKEYETLNRLILMFF